MAKNLNLNVGGPEKVIPAPIPAEARQDKNAGKRWAVIARIPDIAATRTRL